ncbi:MAG: helix-turn-helix domain-containing protein [Pseudobutyrivibrio sp.]|nr:helix-turn-helix domain-containing protein [Pseudobutyrivibrio sp.]
MNNLPLTTSEQQLKKIYKSNPSLQGGVFNIAEILPILKETFETDNSPKSVFDEDIFIPSNLDCSFVRHLRYLPSFLHTHDFFEIVYVKHGSCTNYIGDEILIMKTGDFCFHSPGTVHAIKSCSDEDIVYNIVIRQSTFERYFLGLFSESDILSLFFQNVIYHSDEFPYLIFHTGSDEELTAVIDKASKTYNTNGRFKKQLLNALLAEFFAILLRNHEKDVFVPTSSKNTNDNLVFILHYMEEHYSTVSLNELADFFGYSERQLQRIIKKATGKTFMENIQFHRIKRAEDLLKKSDLPIEQIAFEVGYSSTNNFRRIFEKHAGMTPNAYRTTSV